MKELKKLGPLCVYAIAPLCGGYAFFKIAYEPTEFKVVWLIMVMAFSLPYPVYRRKVFYVVCAISAVCFIPGQFMYKTYIGQMAMAVVTGMGLGIAAKICYGRFYTWLGFVLGIAFMFMLQVHPTIVYTTMPPDPMLVAAHPYAVFAPLKPELVEQERLLAQNIDTHYIFLFFSGVALLLGAFHRAVAWDSDGPCPLDRSG